MRTAPRRPPGRRAGYGPLAARGIAAGAATAPCARWSAGLWPSRGQRTRGARRAPPTKVGAFAGQRAGAVMASQPTWLQAPGVEADAMTATTSTEGSGPVARRLAPAAVRRLPATAGPAIQVAGLRKKFGRVMAVDDVSFTVAFGRITGFLGPNGAGKTTTLRMLLGLVRPDGGTAAIAGLAYLDLAQPLHQVGAVLEASSFHPGRTARNHLRIQALAGQADPSRIDDVLDIVGLTDVSGRRVGKFSLGMRQRLSLAAALLTDPELLILDEPANGLDPEGVRWLRDLLRGLAD